MFISQILSVIRADVNVISSRIVSPDQELSANGRRTDVNFEHCCFYHWVYRLGIAGFPSRSHFNLQLSLILKVESQLLVYKHPWILFYLHIRVLYEYMFLWDCFTFSPF